MALADGPSGTLLQQLSVLGEKLPPINFDFLTTTELG